MIPRKAIVALAATTITLTLLLFVTEVSVRLFEKSSPRIKREMAGYDPLGVKIAPLGELGYKQKAGVTIDYPNRTQAHVNAQGYRGPAVDTTKPPGRFRILLLGGSTTHGWGVDDTGTIDAHMRSALAQRWPNRGFDVVNLAFDGYDALQLVERLKAEGLAYQPDVVIINSGINDVRNSRIPGLADMDSRTLIWGTELVRLRAQEARGRPRIRDVAKHYLHAYRLITLIRTRIFRERRTAELNSATAVTSLEEFAGFPEAAHWYDRNLRRLADLAMAEGIPVVFSTAPSALGRAHPEATSVRDYWLANAALTQAYRDTLSARMADVVADYQAMGHPVVYQTHDIPVAEFLDDCHLTAEGNRLMAEDFVMAVSEWIASPPTRE